MAFNANPCTWQCIYLLKWKVIVEVTVCLPRNNNRCQENSLTSQLFGFQWQALLYNTYFIIHLLYSVGGFSKAHFLYPKRDYSFFIDII